MATTDMYILAPQWDDLPRDMKQEFTNKHFDNWYKDQNCTDSKRLTLLNSYFKLQDTGLWSHVSAPAYNDPRKTSDGNLEFRVANMNNLRNDLYKRNDFTNPTKSGWDWLSNIFKSKESETNWDSRQKVGNNQLHLKNFGNNNDIVQAHIDPVGLVWNRPWTVFTHYTNKNGYTDVQRVGLGLDRDGIWQRLYR